ncbi:protein spinster homolog 1 isoform X2 [Centruroides vittatus]|uniref:protein spinster homolog 1 isoform X2 n=1 Tax=Centruroides vittatus TaxID=120091 RepID=UPI00350F8D0C
MDEPDGVTETKNVTLNNVSRDGGSEADNVARQKRKNTYLCVVVLFFINLINYMDRYTVAGVLLKVKIFYNLNDSDAGLLQTSFVISYMIMAPLFGYLGDRYNRKIIIICGILFWSVTTLAGSFVPAEHFKLFLFLRALVGTGEASYSTIAPTIIADLFSHSTRSTMLAIFYFAIPIGSGLGYVVGSEIAKIFQDWVWALRVTPGLGVISVILSIFILYEPIRGEVEGGCHVKNVNFMHDLLGLVKNRTLMWSTAGFTCVTFATGALAWWAPIYMTYASSIEGENKTEEMVSLIFGVITCIAGIVGVTLGSLSAQWYRRRNPRADPLVCAFGLLSSAPLVFLGIVMAHKYTMLSWFLIFCGETLLCMNWPIVADMLLYVVIPTRRSVAEAFQILVSHAFGDACSPYIVGAISDHLNSGQKSTTFMKYHNLQYSLYVTAFILILGGLCFLMTACYIVQDKKKCIRAIHRIQEFI